MYSRKNGVLFSNSVAKVESNANWITITAQDRPAFTVAINSDSASRDGIITLTQKESGHTCQIKVHQAGADVEEWRYTFNVDPTALTFGSAGGSQSLKVTCYKTKWINNVEQPSTKTPVDWYSEPKNSWLTGVDAPNSQGGGVGSCGISADANSGIYRSGEVIITNSETQFSIKIIVNQAAYVPDVYVFTWLNGSTDSKTIDDIDWNVLGVKDQTSEFKVISTKNGSSHPYSLVSKPSWVTSAIIDSNGISIDISNYNSSTSDRTGNLIFEQDDSGRRLTVVLTQKGQEVSYEFAWNAPNPTLFTHTVPPGTNMATVLAQDLISRKSSDGWATSSLVGATVTTKPSWLTVSLQPNQLDKMLSVILSGTATTTPGTYPVIITQNESGEAVTMNIEVKNDYQFVFADNNSTTMTKSIDSRGQVVMGEWHVNDRDLFLLSYNGSTYVDWEWSSDSSWVYVYDDGEYFNIEADRNDGSARTGILTFTQRESGKKCTLTVSQAGTTQVMDIQITNHTGAMFYLDMNGGTPDYTNATCIPGGSLRQNGGLSFDGVIKISYDHASGDYMEVIFYDNSGNRLPIDYYNYDFNNNQDPDNSIVCTVGSSSLYLTFNKNTSVAPGRVYGTLDCNFAPNYGVAHIEILGYY